MSIIKINAQTVEHVLYDYVVLTVRPWYSFAVTIPKDLVIMIDTSQVMAQPFDSKSRLNYAAKAVKAVINSANPNDHVFLIKCTCFIF